MTAVDDGGTADFHAETHNGHGAVKHTHVHSWIGGQRSFTHAHPWPTHSDAPDASRPHRHLNGHHSHPHGHGGYR